MKRLHGPPQHRGRGYHGQRCRECGKRLIWEMPRPKTKNVRGLRHSRTEWSRNRAKLAFRCADCFGVFCRGCAKKHFVPIQRAQKLVDRHLEKVALAAMREMHKKGWRCPA